MKKQLMIPLLAAPWGAAAFLLRLWQNRTGFEPDTGLPIPGAPAGMVLLAALLVWAVCLGVLVFRLPQEGPPALPRDFPLPDARLLALPVAGVLLMALSGLAAICWRGSSPPQTPMGRRSCRRRGWTPGRSCCWGSWPWCPPGRRSRRWPPAGGSAGTRRPTRPPCSCWFRRWPWWCGWC